MELTWKEYGGTSGVHAREGKLLWWSRPGGLNRRFGEVARSQTFEDFRKNGPAVYAPPEIIEQLGTNLGYELDD